MIQIEQFIKQIAQRFPYVEEPTQFTDIHFRLNTDNAELIALDDDEELIAKLNIAEWMDNQPEFSEEKLLSTLRQSIQAHVDIIDNLGIQRPYSFVLEQENGETIGEIYIADDETVILGDELMQNLDQDLNDFFHELFD